MPETLRFDDLTPYLLLKNGNFLYKVPYGDGFAVVKVYYGSRGRVQTWFKSASNVAFEGQTSYMPKTRLRIERECLALWRRHGFRVYETYDDVVIDAPQAPPGGYTVFEFREGPKLNDYLADETIDLDERFATYRRLMVEWSRRHDLAIELRETRLVHENGDGKHVMIFDDGFHWFDFEMIWRDASRIEDQVAHEILQYLWQISKSVPEAIRPRLLQETVAAYPAEERLHDAWRYFIANRHAGARLARSLDQRFRSRARKPTSKYNVARRLRAELGAQ